MNPYESFVSAQVRLLQEARGFALGGIPPCPRPEIAPDAPQVLIFSPHPDDECIIGGLPLRLLRESRMRVVNVAVTQGSRKDRQAERFDELKRACGFLGYELVQTRPGGLERINAKAREHEPELWAESVRVIRDILSKHRPAIVFVPHETDWNSTHIGTHFLVSDALKQLGSDFTCYVVETEYWGAMATPNLMVESTATDVADLVAGTSFHAGEVRRNPFHVLLPAWMQDNVRRGSELVGGQGEAAPDFVFATLYRLRRWQNGRIENAFERSVQLPATENPASLFRR